MHRFEKESLQVADGVGGVGKTLYIPEVHTAPIKQLSFFPF